MGAVGAPRGACCLVRGRGSLEYWAFVVLEHLGEPILGRAWLAEVGAALVVLLLVV